MSEEEREYLNEMIRSLNNRLVDALRERDEARRMYCKAVADHYEYACNAELDGAGPYTQKDVANDEGWDCFKDTPVVKTLKGVVVSKGKALPPKFELGDDDK